MRGVILALQSSGAVHLGVDNLNLVRHVGRLLDGHSGSSPFELVNDGDLLLLIDRMLHRGGLDTVRITRTIGSNLRPRTVPSSATERRLLNGDRCSVPLELVNDSDLLVLIDRMLHLRGHDTVCISKVKGHADEGMVLDGGIREQDRVWNNAAFEAADFGRRRVDHTVIDARRNFTGGCGRWYPVNLNLHRFFIAISRAVVNHGECDGTAPDPLVWSAGAPLQRRGWFNVPASAFFWC